MECFLDTRINYEEISKILSSQCEALLDSVFQRSLFLKQPFSLLKSRRQVLTFDDYEGLAEVGWTKEVFEEHRRIEQNRTYQERLTLIINEMINHENSKFFLTPVKKETAPAYYDTIKEPMWIEKIQEKLRNGEYDEKNPGVFIYDVNLIFKNAKIFNPVNSIYYKKANELEGRIRPKMR